MVSEASAVLKTAPTDIDTTLRTELSESRNNSSESKTAEIHVLAVDDSSIDRKVIERLLKNSAYKVTTVESGRKALEILGVEESVNTVGVNVSPDFCPPSTAELNISNHAYKINLIITDYCMPGMTGYDLLKKVKETSTLREIPVVIMSSENVPNRISRCLAEGAEEFLLKPVKLSDVKRLRAHVRQQASSNPPGHPEMVCSKRKLPLEGQPTQGSERRPRLNGVTVS